ncbi:hypothetical protein ACFSCX_12865 [Bacillus salitolerans]|uniref:Uncharacterized protein n=1 Tax=Bacillus salitolerans TaxID=1437434 RepID=A0ABW4LQW6_9BACI
MHKKKYFVLKLFMLVIGIILLFFLPVGQKHFVFIVPIVYWVIFYTWIYFVKKIRGYND